VYLPAQESSRIQEMAKKKSPPIGYALRTVVSAEITRREIEETVRRYGATEFISGFINGARQWHIGFKIKNRFVRFQLTLPDPVSVTRRSQAAYDQEVRSLWRALYLSIRGKLESVERGISTFEMEFLSFIVFDNGKTVGEAVIPQLDSATGGPPQLTFRSP
jgi:hypothetical protein